jgi:hypothetical protein
MIVVISIIKVKNINKIKVGFIMAITLKERPIFVIGAPRSGTTLIMAMIGNHSRIAVPEVGWLFPRFYPYLYSYGDITKEENLRTLAEEMIFSLNKPFWGMKVNPRTIVDEILDRIKERSFAGIYCAMHELYAERNGNKPRWGQKTPNNAFFIGPIMECFPNAQFIFIVRDGRDMCTDFLESSFGPNNIFCAAEYWTLVQNAVKPWRDKLNSDQWLDIKYEDLVREPQTVLSKVCDFLGETYEPSMLDFWKSDIAKTRGENPDHKPLASPVSDKYVGIYKRLLSLRDQQIFAAVAGKEMEEAGYSVDVDPIEISEQDKERYREWDGRIRAALLDSEWGHIRVESYVDWLEDERQRRKMEGIWKDEDVPEIFPIGHPHEELICGKRAWNKWKHHFSIKRQYTQKKKVF